MLAPGVTINTHGYEASLSSSGPTPARYLPGGIPVDSNGRICIATGNVSANDVFSNGLRFAPSGAIRGSVAGGSGTNFVNGYWFTDDHRLRISNGDASDATIFYNGDPFVGSGRLALSY